MIRWARNSKLTKPKANFLVSLLKIQYTIETMDDSDWSEVKYVVYQWVRKHPETSIDRSLALWLGVQNGYEVHIKEFGF